MPCLCSGFCSILSSSCQAWKACRLSSRLLSCRAWETCHVPFSLLLRQVCIGSLRQLILVSALQAWEPCCVHLNSLHIYRLHVYACDLVVSTINGLRRILLYILSLISTIYFVSGSEDLAFREGGTVRSRVWITLGSRFGLNTRISYK